MNSGMLLLDIVEAFAKFAYQVIRVNFSTLIQQKDQYFENLNLNGSIWNTFI